MFLNGGEKINQKSQQWETLISIKQIVFGLTEENVSKTVNLLCDEFDKDLSYSFNLLVSQMTFIMFIQRKIAIDTYLSFLNEIKTFEDNNKSKYKIYDVLTRFLLSKNTQESKCLLYYLYKYKIIDPNIIKPPHDPFFVHYMSEKEIKNLEYHDLFHQIEVNYEELSKNDWELHKRLIEEGINPSEITKIIHDDDVGKLQEISSQTNFDFDQEIEASLYERCSFINEGDVKLIDYAAFFGSVKCFKYLLMNGSNISNAGKYAVAGGNIEIIHLCEAEIQISSNEASIEFHQNEIFKYIYENIFKENNDLEELVKKCIEYHNYEILAILLKGEMKIDDDIINKTAEIGNIYLTKYFLDSNQIPKNILPFSSQSGNIELVKYIFEKYGIDVNAKGICLFYLEFNLIIFYFKIIYENYLKYIEQHLCLHLDMVILN